MTSPFHWLAAICLLAICLVLLAACLTSQVRVPTPPARQSRISIHAEKVLPASDPTPPLLAVAGWDDPVPLPGDVNTAGAEDSPFITPDGQTLFFFFTPDLSLPPETQVQDGVSGIYTASRTNGVWGDVRRLLLQDEGRLALDGCPFVLGDTLWFCSAREGYSGVNLFRAALQDGRWQNWQPAGFPPEYQVGELHISADGQELYFHSGRPGGSGSLDLWLSRLQDGEWQQPENLVALNSSESEGWPFLSQDGSELWFTRTHQGAPGIFRSLRVDGNWTEPEMVLWPLAGEPTLDRAGNIYFVHHYLRDGKMIEADIYVANRR